MRNPTPKNQSAVKGQTLGLRRQSLLSRAPRPQDFARPFFSLGFLSRHARRTKLKRDYSWSKICGGKLVGLELCHPAHKFFKIFPTFCLHKLWQLNIFFQQSQNWQCYKYNTLLIPDIHFISLRSSLDSVIQEAYYYYLRNLQSYFRT